MMADWFGALDLLSACSYAEGFGVPIVEAQACGTPVVTAASSAMAEVNATGRDVYGSPWWNPVHRGWWMRPDMLEISEVYALPYESRGARVDDGRVAHYDADSVVKGYWQPILDGVEAVEVDL